MMLCRGHKEECHFMELCHICVPELQTHTNSCSFIFRCCRHRVGEYLPAGFSTCSFIVQSFSTIVTVCRSTLSFSNPISKTSIPIPSTELSKLHHASYLVAVGLWCEKVHDSHVEGMAGLDTSNQCCSSWCIPVFPAVWPFSLVPIVQ